MRVVNSARRLLHSAGRLVAIAMLVCASAAFAVEPDEILADPALEARARAISAELRCLVCQNQSIDDSNAPLARDLRLLVRERLKVGDSDAAVKQFVVDRYGEFALLRPPFSVRTLVLWLAPPGFLLATLLALLFKSRADRRAAQGHVVSPLSAAEEADLNELLEQGDAAEVAPASHRKGGDERAQ